MSGRILVKEVSDYVEEKMTEYGYYTLYERAIPELKDGLKPVHRRLIWTGFVGGFFSKGTSKKCARIVGDCLGHFSPNGDAPVYGALITLGTTANPLFTPQGNFGCKATDDSASAMRYTEAKLSKISELFLLDRDYIAVTPMSPNYDGSTQEPVYLPAKLPIILTQGIEGIATGASTNIPSFSLESVKKLTVESLKAGKCTPKMCFDILKFEFSDGGKIYNTRSEDFLQFYKSGEGKFFVAPEWKYDKALNSIVLTSYSPRFKLDRAFNVAFDIDNVFDIEDLTQIDKSTREKTIRICFKLKKGLDVSEIKKAAADILNAVGSSIPYSIMVTDRQDDGETTTFRYTTVPDIINDWIKWRLDFEVKVVKRLIAIETEKITKLNWLLWAIDHVDFIADALKARKAAKEILLRDGKITNEHADFVLSLALNRIDSIERKKVVSEINARKVGVKEYKRDISSKGNVSKRVVKHLQMINI